MARQSTDPPLQLAYLVSRFPKTTETFVVRELGHVAADERIAVRLCSLFPPRSGTATVHPGARPWLGRVRRPTPPASIGAFLRWTRRRPVVMLTTLALIVRGFGRRPRKLAAAVATMFIACAHAEELQSDGIEHVHAHFVGHPATAAWVIRRLTGIQYSVTAHAYELFQDREFLRPRVRDARFVITISRFNAEFLRAFCGDDTPPISVVHAGVDLNDFTYRERRIPADGPIRTLAVGSLIEHKGHRLLLEALSTDDPAVRRIELTIIGDGDQRPDLERRIVALGLEDRVTLLGSQPENEVARCLNDADLFVLPSRIAPTGRMEGIPVVLMEALACGVPAVATRLSGIPELVQPGVTGSLADQGDVVSLRASIRSTIEDPDRTQAMAREGRRLVEREFDVAASAKVLVERFLSSRRAG